MWLLGAAIAGWGIFGISNRPFGTGLVAWLGLLCGFSYLVLGMFSLLRITGRAARVLGISLIGCSLVFMAAPEFETRWLGSMFAIVRSALVLTGFAAMLHFLLLYPRASLYAETTRNMRVLYIPAFLFWLLVSYRAVADVSEAMNTFTYIVAGIVMSGYFLAGVIVFLRRYIRCPNDERGPVGMRLVLWGSVAGFLPAVVGFMPAFSGLPGNEYYFVSLSLLPLAWISAARSAV